MLRRVGMFALPPSIAALVTWLTHAAFGDDWLIAVGVGAVTGVTLAGALLCWSDPDRDRVRADLGTGLVVSGLIAAAVGVTQFEIQRVQQRNADEASLRLTLALQHTLIGMDLRDARLDKVYLYGKDLREAELDGASLRHATLSHSRLARAHFERARLAEAVLYGAHLRDARLRHAHLPGADLRRADLRRADLTFADAHGAQLRDARLRGAYLQRTWMGRTDLSGADLRGAFAAHLRGRGAILTHACLLGADLSSANLRGADLQGADLRSAILLDAKLDAVLPAVSFDRDTQWPSPRPAVRRLRSSRPACDRTSSQADSRR